MAEKANSLRLYSIGEVSWPCQEDHFWRAFWAADQATAWEMFGVAWSHNGGDWPDDTLEIQCADVTDKVLVRADQPGEERSLSVLRAAGWRWEGDRQCEGCERFEADGDNPDWQVCEDCSCCGECCTCGKEDDDASNH